jgi:hypothetical protein
MQAENDVQAEKSEQVDEKKLLEDKLAEKNDQLLRLAGSMITSANARSVKRRSCSLLQRFPL